MDSSRIYIGTSGWQYDHWAGPFYPRRLSSGERLDYYARRFRSVEVNNSFYRLPPEDALAGWSEVGRSDFVFAVKASRFITHMKKLKEPQDALENFLARAEILGSRLGPILFQLPPRWRLNQERLKRFLTLLPGRFRYAFEFRDRSWFDVRTYRLLSRSGTAFCIYELAGHASPREVTADFVYVRLHGPGGEPYRGSYDKRALSGWAGAFSSWSERGLDVFCYFDNDEDGYAAQNAIELQEMING